jgi:ELWxxDGT repeat protein
VNTVVSGSRLFFQADDGVHGSELWMSDGTESGTTLVKDIDPGDAGSSPDWLAAVGGTVYFQADDGVHGRELWKSDGTQAGTVLVKDIAPGPGSSSPWMMTAIDGSVVFGANDDVHGAEVWRSDGTEAGTAMVQDIAPGRADAVAASFTQIGNRILFTADDGIHGRELWSGRAAVVVHQPVRAVADLRDEVRSLGLAKGVEASLTAKLDDAANAVARADTGSAVRSLGAFLREVDARSPKAIPEVAAEDLLEFGRDIVEMLTDTSR